MTKEPIMIDDVDVSGCNFTLERDGKIKCECTHATGFGVICDCESWKTCDYKNYKRIENEYEGFAVKYTDLEIAIKRKEEECERLKTKIEYVFSGTSSNFDNFCDICVAKGKCNPNCCFEQIKELIYEVE